MSNAVPHPSSQLAAGLAKRVVSNPDYWSFRGNSKREHGHGLMQYPAMMVPQMVRALLEEIKQAEPTLERVLDPFVGSGTVLTEAMLAGYKFTGTDVNPLAVLLCRTKSGPFFPEAAKRRGVQVVRSAKADCSRAIGASFAGRDKWFSSRALIELSRLQRAIRAQEPLWARRYFWVALAATARISCNSRSSTFKLHSRSPEELEARRVSPIAIFESILIANHQQYSRLAEQLRANGRVRKGRYLGEAEVRLSDARDKGANSDQVDVVFTSPPYGDNGTTVPYGQYSYLPLQWVDMADIGADVTRDCLSSKNAIDRMSLGGSLRKSEDSIKNLCGRSPSLESTLRDLEDSPPDRAARVVGFVMDLFKAVTAIVPQLKPNGIMVWVLGNRRVGGRTIPLDRILVELLATQGVRLETTISRRIPFKRMARRNNTAETMLAESIVILRKQLAQ